MTSYVWLTPPFRPVIDNAPDHGGIAELLAQIVDGVLDSTARIHRRGSRVLLNSSSSAENWIAAIKNGPAHFPVSC